MLPARAGNFNEGAAQVRRLVDRDRKELSLDELELTFAEEAVPSASAPTAPSSAAEADGSPVAATPPVVTAPGTVPVSNFQVNSSAADKTPVSPFGPADNTPPAPSPSRPLASFGASMGMTPSKRPFSEPAGLSPNMPTPLKDTTPWWTKVTVTQMVIVASFTTIITLMISTFFFVLSTGAIRFNE